MKYETWKGLLRLHGKDYSLKPLHLNLGKLRPREVKGLAVFIQLLVKEPELQLRSPDSQPGTLTFIPLLPPMLTNTEVP